MGAMIKNIIFDMGGVLIDYNPEKTMYSVFDRDTADILLKEIFRNKIWADRDRGTKTSEDIMNEKGGLIPPDAYEKAREIVYNLYPYMKPFPKMYDFIKGLKEKGYKIYLLSNASFDFYDNKDNIPALSLFDGYLISADYKLLKPEREIYLALYEKYSLDPAECFFIDDVRENVEGALATGMAGHCYSHGDIEILKSAMREHGIDIE